MSLVFLLNEDKQALLHKKHVQNILLFPVVVICVIFTHILKGYFTGIRAGNRTKYTKQYMSMEPMIQKQ